MSTVVIKKDGRFFGLGKEEGGDDYTDFNDPSDAWDYLISFGKMPKKMFIKKEPDLGLGWNELPLKFGWDGSIYEVYVNKDKGSMDKIKTEGTFDELMENRKALAKDPILRAKVEKEIIELRKENDRLWGEINKPASTMEMEIIVLKNALKNNCTLEHGGHCFWSSDDGVDPTLECDLKICPLLNNVCHSCMHHDCTCIGDRKESNGFCVGYQCG